MTSKEVIRFHVEAATIAVAIVAVKRVEEDKTLEK